MSAIQKLVWLLVVGLVQALREKADSVIQSGSGVINSLASTHAKEVHTDEWGFKARALKKEAEKGDAQAAYDLGEMYENLCVAEYRCSFDLNTLLVYVRA